MKRAFILLHISVFLWGFTGIFARAIDLEAGVLVWYRLLLTSSIWLGIAMVTNKVQRVPLKEVLRLAVPGCVVATHWFFFYGSIKYSNISVGMSCLAMIAVFSALLEPLFLKKPFRLLELLLAVFAAAGILIIFAFHGFYRTGIIMGLVSSLLASLFTILNKKLTEKYTSETVTTYELASGFIFLSCLMPLYLRWFPTDKFLPDSTDWILLVIFSVACTVIPFNLSLKALKHLSAFATNLTVNMEPVYGIILAFLIYHEQNQLSPAFYVGTGVILLSVVAYMMLQFRGQTESFGLRNSK